VVVVVVVWPCMVWWCGGGGGVVVWWCAICMVHGVVHVHVVCTFNSRSFGHGAPTFLACSTPSAANIAALFLHYNCVKQSL
jgi:hypothetical protein